MLYMANIQQSLEDFIVACSKNILNEKEALNYLYSRKINNETIDEHCLGYCSGNIFVPDDIRFFTINGRKKDFLYFIQNKIIVPIYSEFGDLISFSTRSPTFEKGYSWWNFPFQKTNHLFLLNKARKDCFDSNKVYIVEGYMDALFMYQSGLKNVCGLMGVELSLRKIGLIARYCNNICLCLDPDTAGQTSQDKIIYLLKEFDFCDNLSIIKNMPEGEDPDVYIAKNGLNSFLRLESKLKESEIKKIIENIKKEKSK